MEVDVFTKSIFNKSGYLHILNQKSNSVFLTLLLKKKGSSCSLCKTCLQEKKKKKEAPFLKICHGIYTSAGAIIKHTAGIDKLIMQYQIIILKHHLWTK